MTIDDRDPLFDPRLAEWLETDPDRAPLPVLDTVLAALPHVRQRGARVGWELRGSAAPARFAAAAGVLLAIGLVTVLAVGLASGPYGSAPTPTPTLAGDWQAFESPQRLYSLRLPPGWTMDPGAAGQADAFAGPEGTLRIVSEPIAPATGQDAWRDARFSLATSQMGGTCASTNTKDFDAISVGDATDRLYELPCLPGWLVLAALGDRGFDIRFTIRSADASDASGKGFALAVLRTLNLNEAPTPSLAAVSLVDFTSTQYGYSIAYPAGWTVRLATRSLAPTEPPWVTGEAVDEFAPPVDGSAPPEAPGGLVVVAAAEVADGTTLDAWTDEVAVATCGTPTRREAVEIDGQPARLLTFGKCYDAFHQWATVVRGTSAFHIVWLDSTGSEWADRVIFDQILATFRFPPA